MAIIRIKRTTGTSLPTGLTFGEMAFVQGSGATANRLFIADNTGVCVWVGAQILNSPTFWSGLTAETTIPTVSAVSGFVNAIIGGATVFPANITLNLSGTKSFGKYTNGQVLPSAGRTPIQVITDALIESIPPSATVTSAVRGHSSPFIVATSIPFGATTVRIGVTWGYTINTPGATAVGATLEFRRGAGAYSVLAGGPFYDNVSPFITQTNGATTSPYYNGSLQYHEFVQAQYDTTTINYRYTVLDTGGAGQTVAVSANITPTAYSAPNASYFVAGVKAVPVQAGDTDSVRERGNTGTSLGAVFTNGNDPSFVRFTDYLLEYQINSNGVWYAAHNNTNYLGNYGSAPWVTLPSPASTITISGLTFTPTAVYPVNRVDFRYRYKDTFSNTTSPTDGALSGAAYPTVNYRKKVFFGATLGVPATPAQVRTLPQSFLLTTNSGSTSGTNRLTVPAGPTSLLTYVIALPDDLTLNDAAAGGNGVVSEGAEVLFGNSNTALDRYVLQTGVTLCNDFSGQPIAYNIYAYTAASAGSLTYHTMNFQGTINNTT